MPAPRPTFSVLVQLMKLRVILLLQVTAICSVFIHDLLVRAEVMAHPEGRRWIQTLSTCWLVPLGGTLSAGGANAINMWCDRDIDAQMTRLSHGRFRIIRWNPRSPSCSGSSCPSSVWWCS